MAKSKDDFWEKYRDPRWQRKRLEVMKLAEFTCEECGDTEMTLHVHHTYYERDKDPWEYPLKSLKCFCDPCHIRIQAGLTEAKKIIGQLTGCALPQLIGYAIGLHIQDAPNFRAEVPDTDTAQGVADAWNLTRDEILRLVDGEHMLDGLDLWAASREKASAATVEVG